MGVNIQGMCSDKRYSHSTYALHEVRCLACRIDGFKGSLSDFLEGDKMWEKFSRFRQLLHFSDENGILVPEYYLENVDYKNSFKLGDSNQLLEELTLVKDGLAGDKDIANNEERKNFLQFYELVKDEVENGRGILVFS